MLVQSLRDPTRCLHIETTLVPDWDEDDDRKLLSHFKSAPVDLYTSPGIRRPGLPPNEPGTDADIVALAAYVLDVDRYEAAAPWAHKAKNLPVTEDDLAAIFGDAPTPSVFVDTGYGWHLWWPYTMPLLTPDGYHQRVAKQLVADFQAPFIERAAARGWHLDASSSPRHLFRLAGSKNGKGEKHNAGLRDVVASDLGDFVLMMPDTSRVQLKVDVKMPATKELAIPTGAATPGATVETAKRVLKQMRPNEKFKREIDDILAGRSFAPAGNRSNAVYAVTGRIAFFCAAKEQRLEPEDFAEILRPSLETWAAEPDATTPLEEEMRRAVKGFRDGLVGFDRERAKEAARNTQAAQAIFPMLRRAGETVTEENAPTPEEYRTTAIIQYKSSFYVRDHGQQSRPMKPGYYGPFSREELVPLCKDAWAGTPDFQIDHVDENGVRRIKTVPKLMNQYGAVARDRVADLSLKESFFDLDTRVFREALCPLRDLEPRFDPKIDEYLNVAFGDQVDKFRDWLACVPDLRFPIAAPYLEGPPGTGKGVIANGISRLWTKMGPVAFERINGAHNDDLRRCPFIVLDEGLSAGKSTSAFIRNLIASTEHSINPKGIAVIKVLSALRVLITANNRNVYTQLANENLDENDADAVAQRFIHFMMSEASATWLVDHNGPAKELTTSWVSGDLFARHVLWLAANRSVIPGKRFLVEGTTTDVHRALVTRGENQGRVLEWLAHLMSNPTPFKQKFSNDEETRKLVKIGDGKFLINTNAVTRGWELYRRPEKNLSVTLVGKILAGLSKKRDSKDNMYRNGNGPRYHEINPDYIFDYASGDAQVGDLSAMRANLEKPLAVTPEQ